MKRKFVKAVSLMALSISLASCAQNGESKETESSNAADVSSTDIDLSEGQPTDIVDGGSYTVSGDLSDGQLKVDTDEEVFIELDGVDITNSEGPAIQVDSAAKVTISAKAGTENKLSDGGSSQLNATVFSNDSLVFEGDGKLDIEGVSGNGIESDDDVTVNSSNISISALNNGIKANSTLTVNGGSIDVSKSEEGLESKASIEINGGSLNVSASDDGINAAEDITINGGEVYSAATNGDGIDSNGTININGGTVVATGAGMPEAGIDSDQNEFNINGGTVLAAGGDNSVPSEATSVQNSVILGGIKKSELLRLSSEDGKEILTFNSDKEYSSVLISTPSLEKGSTYNLFSTAEVAGGESFHELSIGGEIEGEVMAESFTLENTVTNVGDVQRKMGPGGERPMPGEFPGGEMPDGKVMENR
ncbi:hypothetical protein EUAN_04050 [Andreesenia angusta]|uniref:Carbohydrate-binding domain-containing protein n=1 Tax=Andreesenia angusta TaxID=39480 RepID=A0A1S1VAA2_9FIRM|nr:carbohydrate-binding domain-containing protein [Andreesenia angusta]OHW63541.1 hypothetical protein EUAN_04050 [Andreesenia angusta]